MENRNISSYNLSAPFLSIGKKIVVINVTPISTCISRERSPKEPNVFKHLLPNLKSKEVHHWDFRVLFHDGKGWVNMEGGRSE